MIDARPFSVAEPPPRRPPELDLHAVRPVHYALHQRLENWARYVRDSSRRGNPAPMFRYYRPYAWPRLCSGLPTVDSVDAAIIERAVAVLPDDHAYALRWAYVFPWRDEFKVYRTLRVDRAGLHELIDAGRCLLRERLVLASLPP